MKGTVKFYNEEKHFGFIAGDDGKEYFVHVSGLTEGTNIHDDDAVVFEVTQGDRGPKAENVKLDTGDTAAPAEESSEEAEDSASSNEDSEDDSEKNE